MQESPLYRLIHVVRDSVNQPRVQQRLMRNQGLWLQLCSCMDTVEDTESAIESYKSQEYGTTQGSRYLALYGLLQTLFVQQDAVRHLYESLLPHEEQVEFKEISRHPKLQRIRVIRNDSVGHPTRRDEKQTKKPTTTYSFISSPSLNHDTFTLLIFVEEGSPSQETIRIPDLLEDQSHLLAEVLSRVVRQLKLNDQKHKDQFKMVKLADIFSMSAYHVGKVSDGALRMDNADLASISVAMLQAQLQKLDTMLRARGIVVSEFDLLADTVQRVEYALDVLAKYFTAITDNVLSPLESQGAYIFAQFVSDGFKQIYDVVTSIDDDYADTSSDV